MKKSISVILMIFISTLAYGEATSKVTPSLLGETENALTNDPTLRVEIPVETLIGPSEGYDDNDYIKVIIKGSLPPCFQLDSTEVEHLDGNKLVVRQFALKKLGGICAEAAKIPDYLSLPVPFVTEVPIGTLASGVYQFRYTRNNNQFGERPFHISKALSTNIDDLSYASITNVIANDNIQEKDNLSVLLTGYLTSTCTYLDPKIKVTKINDVYVILPTIKVKPNTVCIQTLVPFSTIVHLGKPGKPGNYLVHVRSATGKAFNHFLTVEETQTNLPMEY